MLENAVKIAVDPVFKPPKIEDWSMNELLCCSERLLEGNKFELIYSQIHEAWFSSHYFSTLYDVFPFEDSSICNVAPKALPVALHIFL